MNRTQTNASIHQFIHIAARSIQSSSLTDVQVAGGRGQQHRNRLIMSDPAASTTATTATTATAAPARLDQYHNLPPMPLLPITSPSTIHRCKHLRTDGRGACMLLFFWCGFCGPHPSPRLSPPHPTHNPQTSSSAPTPSRAPPGRRPSCGRSSCCGLRRHHHHHPSNPRAIGTSRSTAHSSRRTAPGAQTLGLPTTTRRSPSPRSTGGGSKRRGGGPITRTCAGT